MGIDPAFLIKHVRPYGAGCVDFVFDLGLQNYLANTLGMGVGDINGLKARWEITALQPVRSTQAFVAAASEVSLARWSTLYQTTYSSIAFMTQEQLQKLSGDAAAADDVIPVARHNFVDDFSGDPIAIAVTLKSDGSYTTKTGVTGLNIGTSGTGNVDHLTGIA